jgi:hypothetical protein
MPTVCSSPFNDDLSADTTFGQPSNVYDSTATTRSLNLEPSPLVVGDGSAYGRAVQIAFRSMVTRHHEEEVGAVQDVAAMKAGFIIRPPTTPYNTPISPPKAPFMSSPPLETGIVNRGGTIWSFFNTGKWQRGRDAHHAEERTAVTANGPTILQTGKVQNTVFMPLTSMEEEEEKLGAFGREPLELAGGTAVTEEAVELHVPDVITQS